jgi:hypothetical protein
MVYLSELGGIGQQRRQQVSSRPGFACFWCGRANRSKNGEVRKDHESLHEAEPATQQQNMFSTFHIL